MSHGVYHLYSSLSSSINLNQLKITKFTHLNKYSFFFWKVHTTIVELVLIIQIMCY